MTYKMHKVCKECGKELYIYDEDPAELCEDHLRKESERIFERVDSLLSGLRDLRVSGKTGTENQS